MAEEKYNEDLFKHWWRYKENSGFLSIREFFSGGRVMVDIGEFSGEEKHNTLVYVPVVDLGVYLRAVTSDTVIYNNNNQFTYYGGGQQEQKPVSRILKIEPAAEAYWWKAGIFPAHKSDTGAFLPDMEHPISTNRVKISRLQMHEVSYRLDLVYAAYLSAPERLPTIMENINGKRHADS